MKKKTTKKKIAKKVKPKVKAIKREKPIGEVTHFYGNIEVAIVKFKKPMKIGVKVNFRGATTDFEQDIKEMQYNHKAVPVAKKGQAVGIKVDEKVRQGDKVYAVKSE